METLIRRSNDILTAVLLCAAAGVVLSLLAFTTSVRRDSTRTIDFTHRGNWSYQAPVPDSSLYASGKVETGEPIFSNLSREATFTFSYSGSSALRSDVSGRGRLVAELRESSGWTWQIPLGPSMQFQGPAAILTGRLQLGEVAAVAQRFREATGVGRTAFEVAVRADLDVSVAAGEQVVASPFQPALVFRYDGQGLIPVTEEGPLAPSRTEALWQGGRVGNNIALLAWRLDVRLARILGLGLLEAAVLGLVVVAFARMDPRAVGARRPIVDSRRMVKVRAIPIPAGARVVEVGSMEELARIAEFEDAMILSREERGVSDHAVVGVGVLYVFRQVGARHRGSAAA